MGKNITFITGIILAVMIIAGCVPVNQTINGNESVLEKGNYTSKEAFNPKTELTAKNFANEKEFENFITDNMNTQIYGSAYYDRAMISNIAPNAIMEKGVSMDSSGEISSSQNVFSETNNQVASVDEADIIKTDGKYIYTITDNVLYIIKAYPGNESEIVSTIKLDSRPDSVFIKGDNLAVFGNFYNVEYFNKMSIRPRNGMTYFTVYNVSNKTKPVILKDYKFEGYYFQARMIDSNVYFVTLSGMQDSGPYPTPLIIEGNVKRQIPVTDIYYYPIPYDYPQLANIHSINLKDASKEITSKSITVEGASNMYMSEKNLYITYTKYINEWQIRQEITKELALPLLLESDKTLIEKIKNTDNEVLSQYEKENKIMQIMNEFTNYMTDKERDEFETNVDKRLKETLDKYEYFEYTIINKVGVNNGEINVKTSGKVPGSIINQFSLDEKDDVLRIATTLSPRFTGGIYYNVKAVETATQSADAKIMAPRGTQEVSTNNVFTLSNELEIMDSIKGIAEDEQIYSTRFIDDRLYMVTFKQIDPFFVIDISNPKDIKEIGKLKIPGFSRYLHPYDENMIIGIGRDATETGRTQGLKISLFDVSNVENPREIAKYVTDEKYAQSAAEYEHKAFLFNKEKELLVIPAYSYNYDYNTGKTDQTYNGAMVFRITKDSITLRGIIDHSKGESTQYYWSPTVERSLYINELLYTKSPTLLRINKIEDLTSVNKIELTTGSTGDIPIY